MESPQFFSKITTTDRRLYITPQASHILEGNQKMWDQYLSMETNAPTDKTTVQKRAMTGKKAEFVWKLVLLINKVEQETGRPIGIPYAVVYAQAALEADGALRLPQDTTKTLSASDTLMARAWYFLHP